MVAEDVAAAAETVAAGTVDVAPTATDATKTKCTKHAPNFFGVYFFYLSNFKKM